MNTWRQSGVVFSVLVGGLNPGLGHCVVSFENLISRYLSLPRCLNKYRWQNAGSTLRWTGIPSRGRKLFLLAIEAGLSLVEWAAYGSCLTFNSLTTKSRCHISKFKKHKVPIFILQNIEKWMVLMQKYSEDHTTGFHPQTQKLQIRYTSP